jgi:hypothetical protein
MMNSTANFASIIDFDHGVGYEAEPNRVGASFEDDRGRTLGLLFWKGSPEDCIEPILQSAQVIRLGFGSASAPLTA